MSTCFCGCMEEIGFLQRDRRQANEFGAEITRTLADMNQYYEPWLKAGRPGFEAIPQSPDLPTPEEQFSQLTTAGTTMREACLATVHQSPGADPPSKKPIKDWLYETDMMITAARMPADARKRFGDAVASGTAAELIEAFEAGKKAI